MVASLSEDEILLKLLSLSHTKLITLYHDFTFCHAQRHLSADKHSSFSAGTAAKAVIFRIL